MLQRKRRRCFPGSNESVEIPHHASVQIVPSSVCADLHHEPEDTPLTVSNICAAGEGRDSCQVGFNIANVK
ncbi:hypothetical protein DPMN_101085 [Dreissena polymorpha]|uniref:Uncharacterized protein n=1 Tax=Dreissena polymorpha TaxID=45954 RepID=A0A9D4LJB0_DREPO|nr:hypothetical protein DPMN_101085 [Dreissena polymorpha]